MWVVFTDAIANGNRYPGYYESLQSIYDEQIANMAKLIKNDVDRTSVSTITREQKEALFRILFSYAKRNMRLGYCQGINSIAFFLLKRGFAEEKVFWIMVYILEVLIPQGYYTNMSAIISDISLFKHMLSIIRPNLVLHLRRNAYDLNCFLIPWFLMAFTGIDNEEVSLTVKSCDI